MEYAPPGHASVLTSIVILVAIVAVIAIIKGFYLELKKRERQLELQAQDGKADNEAGQP